MTSLVRPSDTVAVSNVMPFTSDGRGRDVNAGARAPVTVNGTRYIERGYTISGTGPMGTLTMTEPVSVKDGAAGNPVRNSSHTLWLGNGQDAAFSTDGFVALSSNGTTLDSSRGITIASGNLVAHGSGGPWSRYNLAPTIQVYGSGANPAIALFDPNGADPWAITGSGDFLVAQMPPLGNATTTPDVRLQIDHTTGATKLASFHVERLPRVTPSQQGEIAYATDCRNAGEPAGDGTGCLVTVNRRGVWAAVWSGAPALR